MISVPRYIKVDDESLEIHWVVEMTRIEVSEISSIGSVERSRFRNRMVPVLGSYGFFGYYGYYFNFREWEMLKIYTTERDHLVEIEDIYEQKFLVSCREADKLIEAVMQAKLDRAGEFFDE